MLNKLTAALRGMIQPGDTVVCALSGGADSVALAFGLYLVKDKLKFNLEAAHFNHHLRGEESHRDEAFVKAFCHRYDIPLHLGGGTIVPGKKGLEAAAREARYAFLETLPGKIATAHTADDNAETVLLHLIRGTGLKGLGGIAPVNGRILRPMLGITRLEVEAFLREWCLSHIEDSSNGTDAFLRNRIRHHVMPLLKEENPRLAENLSAMAQRLRQDETYLAGQSTFSALPTVETLKTLHPALRSRALERFLKDSGVKEPEEVHIRAAETLLYSEKPSARADLPGGVIIARRYDRLEALQAQEAIPATELPLGGTVRLPGLTITCAPAEEIRSDPKTFTIIPQGTIILRSRQSGDTLRLTGGTKSLKKLFIDRKIPAAQRAHIPVLSDEAGILGVYGIGPNLDRTAQALPAVTIRFIEKET